MTLVAGGVDGFVSDGLQMMQLSRIDHIQARLADAVETRKDFLGERLHALIGTSVAREIQVHVLLNETIRHAGKPSQRVLDTAAKNLFAEHVVVDRHTNRKLRVSS